MKRSRVAKRYASALFELALESKQLERVAADLELLEKSYDDIEEFRMVIDSPTLTNQFKHGIFEKTFEDHLHPLTFRFVSLLIDKNREMVLPGIILSFQELLDDYRGILRGEVYSVVPLSEQQLTSLKSQADRITGKDVVLSQHIQENLLGGFVLQIQDRVYDNSLRNRLDKLRHGLIES